MADSTTAQNILRGIGGALTQVAPIATGPWSIAIAGIGAAVTLVSDLLGHDLDVPVAIAEIRSVLPDLDAARARLQKLIDERAKR